MKRIVWQFTDGLWLSLAVFLSITSRSWETFAVMMGVFAFVHIGQLAWECSESERKLVRTAGQIGATLFSLVVILLFAWAVLSAIERTYLINADTYPSYLARNLTMVNQTTLDSLQANECNDKFMEIYQKKNNSWIIRCGEYWLTGHTFITNSDPIPEFFQKDHGQ